MNKIEEAHLFARQNIKELCAELPIDGRRSKKTMIVINTSQWSEYEVAGTISQCWSEIRDTDIRIMRGHQDDRIKIESAHAIYTRIPLTMPWEHPERDTAWRITVK